MSPHQMAASTDLSDAVRHWVHFDNLAENLNKQVMNARALRNEYEMKVLGLLERNGLQNASLRINGASLQRASRFKSADLSWSMLEEQLHTYYKNAGRRDETDDVMGFLQKHRGGKTVEYLKKTSLAPSTSQPALPATNGTPNITK